MRKAAQLDPEGMREALAQVEQAIKQRAAAAAHPATNGTASGAADSPGCVRRAR